VKERVRVRVRVVVGVRADGDDAALLVGGP
jgi:hypothetical protein